MTELNLKKYIFNFNWLALEKIIRLGIGFFIGIWLARYLGPESFGILSYSQSITGLLIAFVTLGFGPVLTRDLLNKKYNINTLLMTSIFYQLISSIIIIITIGIYVFKFNYSLENMLIFIISISFIFQTFSSFDSYFQAFSLNKYVAISNILSFGFSSFLKVYFILNNYELLYFAVISVLESMFLAVFYFHFYKQREQVNILDIDFKVGTSLIKDSWPLIPHKIALVVIANIDMIMISKMLDDYSVGIYAMAYKIFLILIFMSSIITKVFFPAIVGKNISDALQAQRFVKLYRLMIGLSLIGIIVYFSIGRYVLIIAFGEQYTQSIEILNILIFSIVFTFISSVGDQWYVVKNYTKAFLFRTGIAAVINIILNYYLIRNFGSIGAAYATLITMMYLAYFSNLYKAKYRVNLSLIHQALFIKKIL